MNLFAAEDQLRLLQLARSALEARVRGELPPVPEPSTSLAMPAAAFVTISRADELRGCLGSLDADRPLMETILHLGAVVADSDPRFKPVVVDELIELQIEISILEPEREVASIDEIEIGRHGLIVEQGFRRGLLLPQVAADHGWDRETFVSHTCLKAGLHNDAWKRGARILVFEAQVFGEREFVIRDL